MEILHQRLVIWQVNRYYAELKKKGYKEITYYKISF